MKDANNASHFTSRCAPKVKAGVGDGNMKRISIAAIAVFSAILFGCSQHNDQACAQAKLTDQELIERTKVYLETKTVHAYAETNTGFKLGSYVPELTQISSMSNNMKSVSLNYKSLSTDGIVNFKVEVTSEGVVKRTLGVIPSAPSH